MLFLLLLLFRVPTFAVEPACVLSPKNALDMALPVTGRTGHMLFVTFFRLVALVATSPADVFHRFYPLMETHAFFVAGRLSF